MKPSSNLGFSLIRATLWPLSSCARAAAGEAVVASYKNIRGKSSAQYSCRFVAKSRSRQARRARGAPRGRGGTYQASLEPLASIICERRGTLPPVGSYRTSRPRGVSPPAGMCVVRMPARRSGESAIAAEALMNNAREVAVRNRAAAPRASPYNGWPCIRSSPPYEPAHDGSSSSCCFLSAWSPTWTASIFPSPRAR